MASVWLSKLKLPGVLLFFQLLFIILFALTVEYDDSADAKRSWNSGGLQETNDVVKYYPMFQDVHVMIFVGFGFLMTFLKRYGYSSVGFNFLLAAIVVQWAILVLGYFHKEQDKIQVGITSLLTADFAAAAVLITFGALLGKVGPLQLFIVAILEIVVFALNEWIGVSKLKAVDIGGSMFVHAFGAYFGLAVSRVNYNKKVDESTQEGSVYHSDLFSMIGTVFLWMFWPSFNSALAPGDDQHRAVINTYLALAACCMTTFAISALVDKRGRFDMVHIQNATLAGGVAVGTTADMMIHPHGALIIGALAGALSTVGFTFITPALNSKFGIHDTCGVNNLHGMPAIFAGIAGAVASSLATIDNYGLSLYEIFPARVPLGNSSEYVNLTAVLPVEPGLGRCGAQQAGYQMAALAVTVVIAVVGGLLTGLIIKFVPRLGKPGDRQFFEDEKYWNIPQDGKQLIELEETVHGLDDSNLDESRTPIYKRQKGSGVSEQEALKNDQDGGQIDHSGD